MVKPDSTVTLIVPVHNNWKYSELLLEGLRKFTDWPYRVLFVDNGSTDETARELATYSEVDVLPSPSNLGYGPAVNRAVARVETDLFAILNNDVYPSPGWLRTWVSVLNDHPEYWQLAPGSNCNLKENRKFRGVSHQSWVDYRDSNLDIEDPRKLLKKYYPRNYEAFCRKVTDREPCQVEEVKAPPGWIAGWAILMRTEHLSHLGSPLFDERFELGFSEDIDLTWRVVQAGGKVGMTRKVYLHHFINATFEILDRDKHDIAAENYGRLVDKWEPMIRQQCAQLTGGRMDRLHGLVRDHWEWRQCVQYLGMKSLLGESSGKTTIQDKKDQDPSASREAGPDPSPRAKAEDLEEV